MGVERGDPYLLQLVEEADDGTQASASAELEENGHRRKRRGFDSSAAGSTLAMRSARADTNTLLVRYYMRVMQLFDNHYQPDLAMEFAYTALAWTKSGANQTTSTSASAANAASSNRKEAEYAAVLWSNIFKHACACGDYDEAYTAVVSEGARAREVPARSNTPSPC